MKENEPQLTNKSNEVSSETPPTTRDIIHYLLKRQRYLSAKSDPDSDVTKLQNLIESIKGKLIHHRPKDK